MLNAIIAMRIGFLLTVNSSIGVHSDLWSRTDIRNISIQSDYRLDGCQGDDPVLRRKDALGKLSVLALEVVKSFRREIAREFGPLDVMGNCVGCVHRGNGTRLYRKDWNFSFNLNVEIHDHMIKTFLPGMPEKNAGSIVNISRSYSSIRSVL